MSSVQTSDVMHENVLKQEYEGLEDRWNELNLLINLAEDISSNTSYIEYDLTYKSLCRSISVLLTSHVEGALKAIIVGFIDDLNQDVNVFAEYPDSIARNFIKNFFFNSTIKDEQKITEIFEQIKETNYKINSNYFKNIHTNAKPDAIVKYGQFVGINSIINCYANSLLEEVFTDDKEEINSILQEIKEYISNSLCSFPYQTDGIEKFRLNFSSSRRTCNASLFKDFLDNISRTRNSVAHGDYDNNYTDTVILRKNLIKIQFLIYGFILIIIKRFGKSYLT